MWSGGKTSVYTKVYLSLLDCILWDTVAINTVNYCKKGDVISIRGRLQSRISERDGEKRYIQDVVGERISFISSASSKDTNITEEN